MTSKTAHRRLLAPEVVQTSAMDCGPAALKCLLEGHGIHVSYGRLREACQTDVDGTSIDTLEEIATTLGLDAEQTMLPVNHLLLPEAEALPALVVVRLANGFTHFVVAWRRHGPWVQLMDPAVGRRWARANRFLDEVYVHELEIPANGWREWAGSDGFLRSLARRLGDLGVPAKGRAMIEVAASSPGWRALATLDASARLAESLVASRAVRAGGEASRIVAAFLESRSDDSGLPAPCWSARAAPTRGKREDGEQSEDGQGEERVVLRGAVLLSIRGRLPAPGSASAGEAPHHAPISPELAAALAEAPARPGRELLRRLREGGRMTLALLSAALGLAAGTAAVEAMILRGAMDAGRDLGLVTQRLGAAGAFLVFALAVLLLELGIARGLLRLGRRLEGLLRVAFLEKIPRLTDRYFQSRPVSDMAERSHSIQRLRELPRLAGQLLRAVAGLAVTACAISLVDPRSAPLALAAAAAAVALPALFKPALEERDLRVKTHGGALSRFYFDALLGLAAARSHGAEIPLRREHESLLVEWSSASRRLLASVLLLEGLQAAGGYLFGFIIVYLYASRGGDASGALLLAYWALTLPVLGDEVAVLARQYPGHRSTTLRLLEPLGAPEEPRIEATKREAPGGVAARDGVAVRFDGVTVRAAGHTIIENVTADIAAGEHVGIVGPSGSGKSSLVGLLFGWHRAHSGRVLADGRPLDSASIERLRREAVWVEPTVQIWNRSFLENVLYGGTSDGTGGGERLDAARMGEALEDADLYGVLERLPAGMQTPLGEGGGLLSGGEGQRVRFARGLFRHRSRLVVLDEPFRGLDREQRRRLLERARRRWRSATLFCITHDVRETLGFDRVLVLEGGRVVEDGPPAELERRVGSRYRALLDAEDDVRTGLWSGDAWRRLRLEDGRVREDSAKGGAA